MPNINATMKVFLKQSTEDLCCICEDYEYVELNNISEALTKRFWSQWSPTPLKTKLIERFGSVRNMYLKLDVLCEKNLAIVKSVALKCALRDGDDRSWTIGCIDDLDWDAIQECVAEYFQSIGYPKVTCAEGEDIARFVQRLKTDVPIAREYFKVLYKYDEEIARIGYFGEDDAFEICVKTDDEMAMPHFHVRDAETNGGRFETCVCIGTNHYCLHGAYKDILSPDQQAMLMDFMESLSRYKPYSLPLMRNYELVVDAWNLNNKGPKAVVERNSGKDAIVPDYANIV